MTHGDERQRALERTMQEGREREPARWEYHARNLDKVPGMALEDDFNKRGRDGWEFVAVAKDYAVFKRRV